MQGRTTRGYSALRKGRYSVAGGIYVVTAVTAGRRPMFRDLLAGRLVINCLRYQDQIGNTETWSFVVMPDHLHWMFQLRDRESLHRVVQAMKGFSAKRLNRMVRRSTGRVWQTGYYEHQITTEDELYLQHRYLVENPIRAGLCDRLGDYALWDAGWATGDEVIGT
jgi:REP-associated tyrosine transposase